MFRTCENGWGRCLKRLAVEYKVYKQLEHNVMGDRGIVYKRAIRRELFKKKNKIVWVSVQKNLEQN